MESIRKDLRFAIRMMLRTPAFTLIAVLTIGLGIGANTAIFSVVHAVLLKPLPYEDADQLMMVWGNLTNRNRRHWPMSPIDLREFREQTKSFEGFAGIVTFQQTLTGDQGDPVQIDVGGVTPNFNSLMGVKPVLGRDFVPEDATPIAPNTDLSAIPPASVMLSYEFWQGRYGGDPGVIGRTLELNGNRAEIIGVMPPGVKLHVVPEAGLAAAPEIWTTPRINVDTWPSRSNVIYRVVGRLRKDATPAQAQAEMDAIASRVREENRIANTAGYELEVIPMRSDLTAEVRPVVLALLGAVGFVLLIACANVSNLLLVRASAREREIAIRTALGGGRARIVRQLLSESAVLALAGGVVGLGLAVAGMRLLVALRPGNLPRLDTVGVDPVVLGFTLAASLLAAVVFGTLPAVQATRPALAGALKDRGSSAQLRGQRLLRNGVVILEVALSVVLLIGAGLMVRSFAELQKVNPGYNGENLLTFRLALPGSRYPTDESKDVFYRQFRERIAALPGVRNVSSVFAIPLEPGQFGGRYGPEEALVDETRYGQATYRAVEPGYFRTMQTRLLEGRVFTDADQRDSALVVIIDEKLKRLLWPNRSAVGQRMLIRATTLEPQWVEVIGVVEHQRSETLARDGRETVYFTNHYLGTIGNMTWIVRTAGNPLDLVSQVKAAIGGMDPLLPVSEIRDMEDRMHDAMSGTRFALVLIGVFGAMALVMASLGLYGVLSYVVRQRTAEIGVRMTFGAEPGNILRLVVGQGMALTGIGLGFGLIGAVWATRFMSALLVDVKPVDPLTFAAVPLMFVSVALIACYVPARRATRVDPIAALRQE